MLKIVISFDVLIEKKSNQRLQYKTKKQESLE